MVIVRVQCHHRPFWTEPRFAHEWLKGRRCLDAAEIQPACYFVATPQISRNPSARIAAPDHIVSGSYSRYHISDRSSNSSRSPADRKRDSMRGGFRKSQVSCMLCRSRAMYINARPKPDLSPESEMNLQHTRHPLSSSTLSHPSTYSCILTAVRSEFAMRDQGCGAFPHRKRLPAIYSRRLERH